MSVLEFLILILIAGICGSIGQAIGGFTRGGCLVSIALGFIGAVVGTWLARTLDFPAVFAVEIAGRSFPVVWSIIGAVVVVLLVGLISGRRRA